MGGVGDTSLRKTGSDQELGHAFQLQSLGLMRLTRLGADSVQAHLFWALSFPTGPMRVLMGSSGRQEEQGLRVNPLMPEVPMLPPQPNPLNLSTPQSPDLTSRESECSSEGGCEQKMLTERSANKKQCCYSTGRAMRPLSGLNEIMHEYHLAHSNCLLKNKCLPYGDDSCQKSEETLPNSVLLQSA